MKTCKYCGNEFKPRNDKHLFCSRSCSMSFRHLDPSYTQNIKEKVTETKNTKEFKKEQSKRSKKQWNDLKKNDPLEFERRMNILNDGFDVWISDDKNRKHLSNKTIDYFKDDSNRKHLSEKRKEWFEIPENYEKQCEINKEIQNRPEVKEKQRSHWKSDKYAEWRLSKMYSFKKYKMPSGRTVSVQGYEDVALDELLKKYKESDIVTQSDGISKYTGTIEYDLNGTHVYKPDIYIKSKNMIVEVKSDWTYKISKEQTHAKARACKDMGFTFYLMIL